LRSIFQGISRESLFSLTVFEFKHIIPLFAIIYLMQSASSKTTERGRNSIKQY